MVEFAAVLQGVVFVYVACGTVVALWVLLTVAQRPGQLDTLAYMLPEDLPPMKYRTLLTIVLLTVWLLWPLVLMNGNDKEGPWKG